MRTDIAAFVAMLVAGLSADAAVWSTHPCAIGVTAAVSLVVLTAGLIYRVAILGEATRGRAVRLTALGIRVGACAVVAGVGVATHAFDSVRAPGQLPDMKPVVLALLFVVQVVQVASIVSRRDVAMAAPVVCVMLAVSALDVHGIRRFGVSFGVALAGMLVSLACVHRADLYADSAAGTQPDRRGNTRPVAWQLARVAVVAVAVFLLLPNSLSLGVHPVARASADPAGSGAAANDPQAYARAIADPATGYLDLRARGQLSDAPLFAVDATAPQYWRGAVYDHYDGTTWTMTGGTEAPWTATGDGLTAVQTAPAPAGSDPTPGGAAATRTDSVQVLSAQPLHVVLAPGRATSYTGPGVVTADADGNPRLSALPPSLTAATFDYDVTSTAPPAAPPTQDGAGAHGADLTDPRWTSLPETVTARVRALATQLGVGSGSRAATVTAVEAYLRTHETYSLDAPVPPPGTDVIDQFLFVSHTGFCEQFASAEVVLLRSLGIPSRLVTGFAFGDTSSEPGKRLMRASDAHAWVQVWYPGAGWVDSDPTAGAPLGAGGAAGNAPAHAPTTARATVGHGLVSWLRSALGQLPRGRLAVAVGVLVAGLLLALVRLVVLVRRRAIPLPPSGSQAPVPRGTPGPVLTAYLEFDAVLAATRGSVPAQTPREVVLRLGPAVALAPEVAAALELLERECYGVEPSGPAETAAAVATFEALCAVARSADADAPVVGAGSL